MEFFTMLVGAGIVFWIVFFFAIISLAFLAEEEKWGWSLGVVVLAALVIQFATRFDPFGWVVANPDIFLLGVVGYFVVGTMWSVVKWHARVRNCRDDYLDYREDFQEWKASRIEMAQRVCSEGENQWGHAETQESRLVLGMSPKKLYAFYLSQRYHVPTKACGQDVEDPSDDDIRGWITPRPRDHKSSILYWISWWPTSMLWALLHDALKHVAQLIYDTISGMLSGISRRQFRNVDVSADPNDR